MYFVTVFDPSSHKAMCLGYYETSAAALEAIKSGRFNLREGSYGCIAVEKISPGLYSPAEEIYCFEYDSQSYTFEPAPGLVDFLRCHQGWSVAVGHDFELRLWPRPELSVDSGGRPEFVAVLSTTVLPLDGVYRVYTLPKGKVPDLRGVPHYIGHPATREIVESLGAIRALSNLFSGLQPGEKAVCFPIAQGKSSRTQDGFTSLHQEVTLDDLQVRVIERLE